MSERWEFVRETDTGSLLTCALQDFLKEMWDCYDQRTVRDTTDAFLCLVASMPGNVAVNDLDRYFVRVYYYLARRPRLAQPRLTILRGFAENYSRLTRLRARDYWAAELRMWSVVHARSEERVDELYEAFLATRSLADNFEQVKRAMYFHLFVEVKWQAARQGWLAAEEDYIVVERNMVYWDPPYQNPPVERRR